MLHQDVPWLVDKYIHNKAKTAVLTAFVGAILLLLVVSYTRLPGVDYVLIIDSGSTGTRIIAYSWQQDGLPIVTAVAPSTVRHKVPRKAAGDVRAYDRVETEPGLDKFVDDIEGLSATALQPLLAWAEAAVPPRQWKFTPLFLFGTAGLRVLSAEQQTKLLESVQEVLGLSAFRFEPEWARVISGIDEGIYGWVALNYLTGHLAMNSASLPVNESGRQVQHPGTTVGAVDLGGSSLEVTFVPDDAQAADAQVQISILGSQYNLYSHVHHSFGLNDAFDRSVALLYAAKQNLPPNSSTAAVLEESVHNKPLDQEDTASQVMEADASTGKHRRSLQHSGRISSHTNGHRALPSSYVSEEEAVSGNHVSEHMAVDGSHRQLLESRITLEHPCLHLGYAKDYTWVAHGAHVAPLPDVHLVGRPDWAACQALARAVAGPQGPCDTGRCALMAPQPLASHKMYALTGFYVVYKFFGLPSSASFEQLEEAGRQFCSTPWSSILETRAAEIHVDRYCFRVPYVIQLLREGLGLAESQIVVGSGREGWTLGAALSKGSEVLPVVREHVAVEHMPGGLVQSQLATGFIVFAFVALPISLIGYLWYLKRDKSTTFDLQDDAKQQVMAQMHRQPSSTLTIRMPKSSSLSSLQLHSSLDDASMSGKFSPPPTKQNSNELHRLGSMARTSSIAGHRKRQMSVSSLDIINTDAGK